MRRCTTPAPAEDGEGGFEGWGMLAGLSTGLTGISLGWPPAWNAIPLLCTEVATGTSTAPGPPRTNSKRTIPACFRLSHMPCGTTNDVRDWERHASARPPPARAETSPWSCRSHGFAQSPAESRATATNVFTEPHGLPPCCLTNPNRRAWHGSVACPAAPPQITTTLATTGRPCNGSKLWALAGPLATNPRGRLVRHPQA